MQGCFANDVSATSFCRTASSGQDVILNLPNQLANETMMLPPPDLHLAAYLYTSSEMCTPELTVAPAASSSSSGGSRNSSEYRIPNSCSCSETSSDVAQVQFIHGYDEKIFHITKVSAYDFAVSMRRSFLTFLCLNTRVSCFILESTYTALFACVQGYSTRRRCF